MDLEMPGVTWEVAKDLHCTRQFSMEQLAQTLRVVQLRQAAFS